MFRSNELSPSSRSDPEPLSGAHVPHPKEMSDPRLNSNNPLSADEIDAQIRWFFAQDLAAK